MIIEKNNIKYRYDGIAFRFHYNSEHTLGGVKSDLEIQIIHKKNTEYLASRNIADPDIQNDILAISIRVNADGQTNPEFEKVNFKNYNVRKTNEERK